MKAILIFCRQSGIAAATLCCKQGSFQSSAILRSVLSQSFLEREHLSNFCNLSSSRCSFTTFLLHFHQLHLCICSRMTCKSGHCPCRSECNKFKKSDSKPATDSMKATKPTAHWQHHHLRLREIFPRAAFTKLEFQVSWCFTVQCAVQFVGGDSVVVWRIFRSSKAKVGRHALHIARHFSIYSALQYLSLDSGTPIECRSFIDDEQN